MKLPTLFSAVLRVVSITLMQSKIILLYRSGNNKLFPPYPSVVFEQKQ